MNFVKEKCLWKSNNNLIQDSEYVKTIKDCTNRVKEQYIIPIYNIQFLLNNDLNDIQFTISDQLLLEALLIEIRGKDNFILCI